jgi:hypothetical protein
VSARNQLPLATREAESCEAETEKRERARFWNRAAAGHGSNNLASFAGECIASGSNIDRGTTDSPSKHTKVYEASQ